MFQGKIKVLLFEDNPGDVLLIKEMFKEEAASRFELASVARLADGIKCLSEQGFDAVLLDLNLPDSIGIDTARSLKQNAPNLPIVILTALADESVALEALRIGMEDYLVKGQITGALLVHSLRYAIERKKAGDALRVSEDRFRAMVENAFEGISIINTEGITVYTSPTAYRIMGMSEEIVGASFLDNMHPDDIEDVAQKMARLVSEPELKVASIFRIKFPDGSYHYIENTATNLIDNPNVGGIVVNFRDITERKRAEEALRKSEEKYRQLIDTLQEGIWLIDKEANTTFVNPRMAEMLGYTPEEMQGKHLFSFMDEKGVEIAQRNLERRRQGITEQHDFEFVRKDGSRIYTILETGPITDEKGEYIGALAGVQDITQRKKAEEDVKRHAKRIEALYGVAQVISQSSTIDAMLDEALDKVCDVMDTESGCIFMLDCDDKALKLKACKGLPESIVPKVSTIMLTEQGIEGLMDLTGPITDIDDTQDVVDVYEIREVVAALGRKTIVAVPFFRGKDLQGLIVVFTTKKRTFSGEDLDLFTAIANEIAVGLNNIMLLEKTRDLSVTDELTGLYNRRHFFEMLDVEMNRAGRTKRPFSLVMLDLDGFKEYNDKFGHINGDAALQAFSQMLKASIRKSDLAFRYGGDEFALILPIADAARAKKIMQRARSIWQESPVTQAPVAGGHVDFSTGIAEYPENAESADGMVFLADAALYQAKRKGGHEDKLVSELRTLSTDIMDVATQDQVYALAATVDSRDPYTYGHSQRVAEIAKLIGRATGMADEDLAKLHAAALLHDVGKVGVPDAILTKMGKLNEEERRVLKRHSAEGARIVGYVRELASLVPIILHHHEWYDGTGYPDGLKGIDIPSGARITSIADAYDTMVTKRPYRNVVLPKEACAELRQFAGVQFDPALVDVWCKLVGEDE